MPSLPIVGMRNSPKTMAMAASMARTVIKPHIPQIKFPVRGQNPAKHTGSNIVIEKPGNLESLVSSNIGSSGPGKSTAAVSKGPTIDPSQLHPKYQRKPLSMEEIEYIEKGGQV